MKYGKNHTMSYCLDGILWYPKEVLTVCLSPHDMQMVYFAKLWQKHEYNLLFGRYGNHNIKVTTKVK